MGDRKDFRSLVLELSDLEIALLLSLAANEHCLIETTEDCIHDVAKELTLITAEPLDRAKSPISWKTSRDKKVVDIVVAKNFNLVDDDIQLQALELMRSKRLDTQHGTIEAPSGFLFVPLTVRVSEQLHPSLNYHLMLGQIQQASNSVSVGADIVRYQQDIVVFLRLNRAVAGGITARSNMQFSKLAKFLTTLHGIDYLTPSIVAVSARKVFRHRIIIAKPEDDRSLQYGSDMKAVAQALAHVSPDTILDGVLTLEAPL
ncbi:uncharacterized protein ACLA_016590 [Aspergillus clavatus NRRL 1]|uniref:magnesium chelatase n=1 Tax=Aspergillus clavatus (strain ATCC 1007 / CBS 513.65 / DSM 816 / NCTC 3887 / NRRL 1 / QM 1276 / 107) TaxID=344612 RepID=A1CBU5_ASPCL|nr:uncharacterized protein ACLA_016590 [Aspergillus clavatus NRRL 1]EAW13213.1 hypothetical protein ACLA_016590 [Aspergillus clavatus NRRL 1]